MQSNLKARTALRDRVRRFGRDRILKHRRYTFHRELQASRCQNTCCADDIGFVGMLCKGPQADNFKLRDWVKVTAKVAVEYQREYGGEGPVLYLVDMVHTAKPKEHLIYMN